MQEDFHKGSFTSKNIILKRLQSFCSFNCTSHGYFGDCPLQSLTFRPPKATRPPHPILHAKHVPSSFTSHLNTIPTTTTMRRVPRALALPRASTPFQCISRPAFSTSAASNGITDTLREKMWKPQRQPKEEARRGLPEDESYVPAKDGRGLRIVGLLDPVKDTEWVLER